MAFLVATPATSITALFVCWKLLGMGFTVLIFFAAIIIGLFIGIICDGIALEPKVVQEKEKVSCCQTEEVRHKLFVQKLRDAIQYAFITLPKSIGLEIILGIGLSSFIVSFSPIQHFIKSYLTGLAGYFVIIVFGLLTYVCSTASVPIAHAFITTGLSYGQAFCFLFVGPITSYGTILVINKEFGKRVLTIYLTVIIFMSFLLGILMDTVFTPYLKLPIH